MIGAGAGLVAICPGDWLTRCLLGAFGKLKSNSALLMNLFLKLSSSGWNRKPFLLKQSKTSCLIWGGGTLMALSIFLFGRNLDFVCLIASFGMFKPKSSRRSFLSINSFLQWTQTCSTCSQNIASNISVNHSNLILKKILFSMSSVWEL